MINAEFLFEYLLNAQVVQEGKKNLYYIFIKEISAYDIKILF